MKSIGEKIADGIQKFYTAFINQRVLTTPEEVQANTNEKNLASAVVVGEIYNKLNGCSLEQVGEDFYIVGADSVRKKLCSGKYHIIKTHTQGYGTSNVTVSLDKSYSKFLLMYATSPSYEEVIVKSPSSGLTKIHILNNEDCSLGFYEYSGNPVTAIVVAPARVSILVLTIE